MINSKNRIFTLRSRYKLRAILISLLSFTVFFLMAIICSFVWRDSIFPSVNGVFSYELKQDFKLSFLASVWENIIFFLLVGIAVFVASLYSPEDESFDVKLTNLFSADGIPPGARTHADRRVHELASYCSILDAELSVREHLPGINCFKIYGSYRIRLHNMKKDSIYEDREFPVKIFTDGSLGSGVGGEIFQLGIRKNGILEKIIEAPQDFQNTSSGSGIDYEYKMAVSIEDNSFVDIEYSFWILNKDGVPYAILPYRYTENLRAKVINGTKSQIYVKIMDMPKPGHSTGDIITLSPSASVTFDMSPADVRVNAFAPVTAAG